MLLERQEESDEECGKVTGWTHEWLLTSATWWCLQEESNGLIFICCLKSQTLLGNHNKDFKVRVSNLSGRQQAILFHLFRLAFLGFFPSLPETTCYNPGSVNRPITALSVPTPGSSRLCILSPAENILFPQTQQIPMAENRGSIRRYY